MVLLRNHYLLFIFGIALAAILFWCYEKPLYQGKEHFIVMSTAAETILWGPDKSELTTANALVKAVYRDVETHCNIFNEASEISKLNRTAAILPVTCSDELYEILSHARDAYRISDGAFDISIRPLMDLWGFARKRSTLPSDSERADIQRFIGLHKIEFCDTVHTVAFPDSGFRLDLGGIAKGCAVDRAAESVMNHGIKRGIINLGGNIRVLSEPPPNAEHYEIAIQHPLRRGKNYGTIPMLDQSVATSGSYERYTTIGNRRYSHIIDPVSGMPVGDTMLAVTVIAPTAAQADALSTAIFIRGEAFADTIHRSNPAIQILIFIRTSDGSDKRIPQRFRTVKYGNIWEKLNALE